MEIPSWIQFKTHGIVLIILIISVLIGLREIKFGHNLGILINPFIYALILGLVVYLAKPIKFIGREQAKFSESFMILLLGVLMAKLAISCGESIAVIFNFGYVLILQEIGNLGTLIALPVALILGFKRESIGMTTSICREPSLSVMIDRFGVKSPEFNGTLIILIIGSVLGTIIISLLTSISISFLPFHPYAYAMASGIGSVTMSTSSVTSLCEMFPSMATDLQALSGCSNILSTVLCIYLTIFLAIPIGEGLYGYFNPILGKKAHFMNNFFDTVDDGCGECGECDDCSECGECGECGECDDCSECGECGELGVDDFDFSLTDVNWSNINKCSVLLIIFSFMTAFGCWLGVGSFILYAFIGMLIISAISLVGMIISSVVPYDIPSIVYISLISIILAIPFVPMSDVISYYVSFVNLDVICVVFMAYVGIAIGEDWEMFKKIGPRGIIVTLFVIAGTFYGSAIIAQLGLFLTNFL